MECSPLPRLVSGATEQDGRGESTQSAANTAGHPNHNKDPREGSDAEPTNASHQAP